MLEVHSQEMFDDLVRNGKKIAIVGPMGGGKTEELSFILRTIATDYRGVSYAIYNQSPFYSHKYYPANIAGMNFVAVDYSDSVNELKRQYGWLSNNRTGAIVTLNSDAFYDRNKVFEYFDYVMEIDYLKEKREIYTNKVNIE